MNRPGPAPERGGTPSALAAVRKGGLKKARNTSVIADMTRTDLPEQEEDAQQPERLHVVPALDVEPVPAAPVPAAPAAAVTPDQTAQAQQVAAPQPAQPPAVQAQPVQQVPAQVAAPQQPVVYAQPVQYAPPPAQVQSPDPVQQPAPEPPAAEKKTYRKTSFFQSQESGSRMRSAYMATRHLTGSRTLSDFILAAVEREVEALEKRYNDGNVFDADPGSVPRGRPLEL